MNYNFDKIVTYCSNGAIAAPMSDVQSIATHMRQYIIRNIYYVQ